MRKNLWKLATIYQYSKDTDETIKALDNIKNIKNYRLECPECGSMMEYLDKTFGCGNEECGLEIQIIK